MEKLCTVEGFAPLHVRIADTFLTRFLGLMGRKRLADNAGLFIAPCSSIHMMFMRFSIDAVYLSKEGEVLKVAEHVLPWIGLSWCMGAHGVLELPSGSARAHGLTKGKRVIWKEASDATE